MFKSVKYEGFEDAPELRAKCEAALPILLDEIRTWTERVEVTWQHRAGWPDINLKLALDFGSLGGSLDFGSLGGQSATAFPDGLPDAPVLRDKVRAVWGRLLDLVLEKQSRRLKAELESAGAA